MDLALNVSIALLYEVVGEMKQYFRPPWLQEFELDPISQISPGVLMEATVESDDEPMPPIKEEVMIGICASV